MNLVFAGGHEFGEHLTFFGRYQFRPQWTRADLEGTQQGLCFSTCDISSDPVDVSRGTIRVSDTRDFFTFDTEGALGVSLRVWRFRLTTQAGVRYATDWVRATSRPAGNGSEPDTGQSWGYFGRASVTVAIP